MNSLTYTTSDLARRRTEITDEARDRVVFVRDVDGTMLIVSTAARESALMELVHLYGVYVRALHECRRAEPSPIALGEVGFIARWTTQQRHDFLDGFAEALAESERTADPGVARRFIMAFEPSTAQVPVPLDDRTLASLADAFHARSSS